MSSKNQPQNTPINNLWGGRFSMPSDHVMEKINASIMIDKRLWREDITASKAHAHMLQTQNIISSDDNAQIQKGLDQIALEIEAGQFIFDPALEDIHMHIEARLTTLIGEPGKKLHTARSRNDQVATDFRLYLRAALKAHQKDLTSLITRLLTQAEKHQNSLMPGYTHLQAAQPISLGHHLMAYVAMFLRDRDRLSACCERLNECPLGAGALAGTSYPIDRHQTAHALGFRAPMANSLDAVSARDFAQDYLASLSILATHLSRLAEEIILWASSPFGFIKLDDRFSTGSSIMPQKRNPDAAELIRAKSGRISGSFQALSMVLKGLPMAYSKDMQEDKALVFACTDDMSLMLAAMDGMIETLQPCLKTMRLACDKGYITATDLADTLVQELGISFRDAHHITGQMVKKAEAEGLGLPDLPLAHYQSLEPRITEAMIQRLHVEASVASRKSFGGTAAICVQQAIDTAREIL